MDLISAIGPEKEVNEYGVIGFLWRLYAQQILGNFI